MNSTPKSNSPAGHSGSRLSPLSRTLRVRAMASASFRTARLLQSRRPKRLSANSIEAISQTQPLQSRRRARPSATSIKTKCQAHLKPLLMRRRPRESFQTTKRPQLQLSRARMSRTVSWHFQRSRAKIRRRAVYTTQAANYIRLRR